MEILRKLKEILRKLKKTQGNIKKTQGNFRKTQGFFAKTQPNRQIYLFMNSELWRIKKPGLTTCLLCIFSNVFTCIWFLPKGPRSPPLLADEQSENSLARSSKVASLSTIFFRWPY